MKCFSTIGAILGDIAGSSIEFHRPIDYDAFSEPLFPPNSRCTDDTMMTLASALTCVENLYDFQKNYLKLGRNFPEVGYGGLFKRWLHMDNPQPYNSFGNGSAMRASPIADYCYNLYPSHERMNAALSMAEQSAACTHNHPEGIKGAQATVFGCMLGYEGRISQMELARTVAEQFGYDISLSLNELRPIVRFDCTCQGSLPLALRCLFESNSYENCLRNVMSMRCDTDTVGAIAGAMAAAHYKNFGSISVDEILNTYLNDYQREILNLFEKEINKE